ncbi:MAG: hypothetical protein M1838_002999 [Thelocarpon superellum]|nr:MAG: hypothetical protein M1838_002999 [Thelocarpon superellum]
MSPGFAYCNSRESHLSFDSRSYSDASHDSPPSSVPTSFGSGPSVAFLGYAQSTPEAEEYYDPLTSPGCTLDFRASSETYASTQPSEDEAGDIAPEYEVPEMARDVFPADVIPSSPPEFGELFPSTRRLYIRHDDTTVDGNMNLRVDTEVTTTAGRQVDLTLFHLRMYDLKNRDFSLRRYCRDSGREVCHSARKYRTSSAPRRPSLQRSVSHAIASMLGKHENKDSTTKALQRQDSGYDSSWDESDEPHDALSAVKAATSPTLPTKTIQLEFSNYAHVNVKRRGVKASKRYEFDYWGSTYNWKRTVRKSPNGREVSFHLVKDNGRVVAYITPVPLSTAETQAERTQGGWIPPCSLWISDPDMLNEASDVADTIVATGLMALVDDTIKCRFHSKRSVQLVIPLKDYVAPKKLIDEVFHRHGASRTEVPTASLPATAKTW